MSADSTSSRSGYAKSLAAGAEASAVDADDTLVACAVSVYLYIVVPKGFFPQQDTGRIGGAIVADQDTSFAAMREKLHQLMAIVSKDPAIQDVNGFTGGGTLNVASMRAQLKPLAERKISADHGDQPAARQVVARAGATLYMQAEQDFRVGGRGGNSQYQYTLTADNLKDLNRVGAQAARQAEDAAAGAGCQ